MRADSKARLEQAAAIENVGVSDFVRSAAEARADEVLREHDATTRVPAEFFDDLMSALEASGPRILRWPRRLSGPAGWSPSDEVTYRSESLDPDRHDVEHFRCGEASLDDWLREQARPAAVRRTARTWVWTDGQGAVVGYYTLSAHKVSREQVP